LGPPPVALPAIARAQVHVDGQYRGNGMYVQPYQRTRTDGTTRNNYSSPGNYNPNTGRVTPPPGDGNHPDHKSYGADSLKPHR
jgi:hypothetical protein